MAKPILSAAANRQLAELAEELDLERRLRALDLHRWRGEPAGSLPTLQLDDVSSIPFLDGISGVEEYQHRARTRAKGGDLFAAVTPPVSGYEDYCRGLGLGSPELVMAEPVGHPLEVARASGEGEAFATITRRASLAGGMFIHPYMGTEPVWALARSVAEESRTPVTVMGPPPPVTWIANDKVLFARVVRIALGDELLPAETVVTSRDQIAAALIEMAAVVGGEGFVGVRRARCASAMGNHTAPAAPILRGGHDAALATADAFIESTAWPEGEPAIVVEWLDASASPSTQLWIPPLGRGPVIVEGVYEQILEGEAGLFVGSRPSTLSAPINTRLAAAASAVGSALQVLGYVGRCSFDHLVIGELDSDVDGEPRIVFVECNGRWGGTSTPMSLVDRLIEGPRPSYRAQDVISEGLIAAEFTDICEALGDELYSPRGGGRFILYNVGPMPASGKLDVIALGADRHDAEEAMLELLPRLLKI